MKKILLAIFALFFSACNIAESTPKNYSLISLGGKKVTFSQKENLLSANGNRPYLLLFLSSWCDYCLGQAQHIANINAEFGEAINVYGIFVDKDESEETLKKFASDSGAKFEWFYNGDIAKLVENYHISTFPFMLLYDKNGNLKQSYDGLTPEEMIAFDIKRILGEK
ncbi:TlpA family protein disulfide reductase [Helicobacter sp. 23-1044]